MTDHDVTLSDNEAVTARTAVGAPVVQTIDLAVGDTLAVSREVPPPPPPSDPIDVFLIDPVTDTRKQELQDGEIVYKPFALEIVPEFTAGSVKITYLTTTRIENNAPYSVFGDSNGDFSAATVNTGMLAITIRAFSGDNASGTLLSERVINLDVRDQASTSNGPSGIAVPSVKTGWKRVGFSHFDDDIPAGSWTGDPDGAMMGRASGVDTSQRGTYTLKGLSQHDSLLDSRMWQDSAGKRWMGCPMNKAPNPSNSSATAPLNLRVTECMKVAAPEPGWKMAHMMAKYGAVRSQEFDYPEAQFGTSGAGSAFTHASGTDNRITFPNGTLYSWHTYTIERKAGQYVQYELDGNVLGKLTNGMTQDRVHWILQNETAIGGTLPAHMGEAHVLVDWVTIDVPV